MPVRNRYYRVILYLFILTVLLCTLSVISISGVTDDESSVSGSGVWNSSGSESDSLKNIWNYYTYRGMHDSAIFIARPAFKDAVRKNDTMKALFAGASVAQSFLMKENADSVKYYLSKIRPYMQANQSTMLGVFVNNVAGSYSLKYDLDYGEALRSFKEASEWASRGGDLRNQIVMLANIVNIFYIRSDAEGLDYAERAVEISVRNDVGGYAKSLAFVSMAEMLYLSGDYERTLNYVSEAINLSEKYDIAVVLPVIYLLYADTYKGLGDNDAAENYYKKALSVSSAAEPAMLSKIYMNYASWCEDHADYQKAMSLYRGGLELSYRYRNLEFRCELLDKLSDLAYLLGDKEASLKYYRQYKKHLDSVSLSSKDQAFNDLLKSFYEMKHRAEVQEKELALLNARKRTLYICAILILVVVILGFLWMMYRRQQKMYRTLVLQHQSYMRQLDSNASVSVSSLPTSAESDAMASSNTQCGEKNASLPGTSQTVSDKTADELASDSEYQLFRRLETLVKDKKIYTLKDLSLDKIAEMLGTNRTYVSKAINDIAGTSYYNYIDAFRIREATRIISESEDDVPFKSLSDDLGYNSISVFYKAFRNATGCTPGQYRAQIKQIRKEKLSDGPNE